MKVDFISIGTSSAEQSIKFYQDVLGFTLYDSYSPASDVKIAFMSDGHGLKIELIEKVMIDQNRHSNISIGFEVDDINETKHYLENKGVKIISGPTSLPHGVKLIHARDPNGISLGFVEHSDENS